MVISLRASRSPWTLAVAVALASAGAHAFAAAAPPAPAPPAKPLDLKTAAADAEVIVIGSAALTEIYNTNILGKRAGLAGYRFESSRLLKGADQGGAVNGKPMVIISLEGIGPRMAGLSLPDPGLRNCIYFLRLERVGRPTFPRAVPLARDAWFLPATPENVEAVGAAIPLPAKWGEPSDGLAFGLRPVKPSYHPGEPVDLELGLRNVSDHPLRLPQHRVAANDGYPYTTIWGGTGIRRASPSSSHSYSMGTSGIDRYVFFSKSVGREQAGDLPPVILEPGEVYIERVRLDSWQWSTTDGLTPFVSGARWMLQANFDTREPPALVASDPAFFAKNQLWKGYVRSEYVEVNIE